MNIPKVILIKYNEKGQEAEQTEVPHPISNFNSPKEALDFLNDYYKDFGEWRQFENNFICNYQVDGVAFCIKAFIDNVQFLQK